MALTQRQTWSEALGWYGVAAILCAYAGSSFGILDVGGMWYQMLNATGAIGIVADAWQQKNWQPVVLNAIWFVVAFVAIMKGVLK